jgi:hypothetical protein
MRFLGKIKWVIIVLLIVIIVGWIYIRYDNRAFLRYGVLRIDKFPNSLKIIDDESSGWINQQYDYTISIDSAEMNKLLSGRHYINDLDVKLAPIKPGAFYTRNCYTSGYFKNGLVSIYVNEDRSMAYIVYDIE